jgi:maltooligosyltrehalose trehalohydrolase
MLLSPYVPLLFMGEEYGETAPFLYFIEHGDPALVEAVREGRKKEFKDIGKLEAQIDPQADETFNRSRLDWSKRESQGGAQLLSLYRDLLALRREEPALKPGSSESFLQGGADWFTEVRYLPARHDMDDYTRSRRALLIAFNISPRTEGIPIGVEAVGAWRLRLSTDATGYGGSGQFVELIPAAEEPTVNDAPKRLLDVKPTTDLARTIILPPWSAAVYVRDFPDDYGQWQS